MNELALCKKCDVLFVLPQLRFGGVQVNRIKIIKGLLDTGMSVGLVTISSEEGLRDRLPDGVDCGSIVDRYKWLGPFRLFLFLMRLRPRVVVSAYPDLNLLISFLTLFLRYRPKLILSYHAAIGETISSASGLHSLKWMAVRRLMPFTYNQAHSVIAVSEGLAKELTFLIAKEETPPKLSVIHNPIVQNQSSQKQPNVRLTSELLIGNGKRQDKRTICFVGRLEKQKNVPLLIQAFAKLSAKYQDISLMLIGDGSCKEYILDLVERLGIQRRVEITGFIADPTPFIEQSDVLVLPSDYEGFGNVLVEAMACGTQVIATDCPHGPREILQDGSWGQLVQVGDTAGLVAAMEKSLTGEFRVEPEKLKARAAEFGVEGAVAAYQLLIEDALDSQIPSERTETLK